MTENDDINKKIQDLKNKLNEVKKNNRVLKIENELIKQTVQNVPISIVTLFQNGGFRSVNKEFSMLTGYSEAELHSMSVCDIIHPDFIENDLKNLQRLWSGKIDTYCTEKKLICKNGTEITGSCAVRVVRDKSGNPIFSVGQMKDVTKQRKMENELRESGRILDLMLNSAPDIIYRLNTDGSIVFINKAIETLGFTREELLGRSIMEIVHPDDKGQAQYRLNERRTGERSTKKFELRLLRKTAESVPFENNTIGIEEKYFVLESEGLYGKEGTGTASFIGTLGVARDITDRKIEMEELQNSKQRLRHHQEQNQMIIDNSEAGFIIYNSQSEITLYNKKAKSLYCIDENASQKPQKRRKCQLVYENGNPIEQNGLPVNIVIYSQKPLSNFIAGIKPPGNNKTTWLLINVFPVFNENKEIDSVIESFIDITDLKTAQEALEKEHRLFKTLIDNLPDRISVKDRHCRLLVANHEAVKAFEKIGRTDIIGRTDLELLPRDLGEKYVKEEGEIIRTGVPIIERLLSSKDKSTWTLNSKIPIHGEDGEITGILNINRDITNERIAEIEKKKLEEQLYQSQKMESIGRLAGGIAHDFNNILTGILGYAELLKLKFGNSDSLENEAVNVIFNGAERASDLTKQLLGFARGGKYNPVAVNVNEVLKDTIKVLEKIFEKNIKIVYGFDEQIHNIEADQNQIYQIFTNIIINAKDAMPKGGTLTLKTENVLLGEKDAQTYTDLKPGHHVCISVSDTGIGMTPDIIESIFEPFYTTKGKGKGTGLGLATVYGIVKNHGGNITVNSKPDAGSTFTMLFPISNKETPSDKADHSCIKGNATILVVDDEINIRKMAKNMLTELNYNTILAEDGKGALEIFKNQSGSIDLVILDMIMPNLSGAETIRELKKIDPGIKVLLSSGFAKNDQASESLQEGADGFIQKPFKMETLSRSIVEILNRGNGRKH